MLRQDWGWFIMDTIQYLCERTKELWDTYMLHPNEENFEKIFKGCSQNMVMIGTGKHEVFDSRDKIIENLYHNLVEAEHILFSILDEWYEGIMLDENVCLIYGGIWVREKENSNHAVLIEMDTRFSILYRREENHWSIVHMHHSMPNDEQMQGEYYPKALSKQAKEALELVEKFKLRAELDLMTSLYNHESFQIHAMEMMENATAMRLYVFDCDYFKEVNDTFGHLAGDSVLKLLATLLKSYFKEHSILGRIGGDEFVVLQEVEEDTICWEKQLEKLRKQFSEEAKHLLETKECITFSVGVAMNKGKMRYHELFKEADRALYKAKRYGKNKCCWSE